MVRWSFMNETKVIMKAFFMALGYFARSTFVKDPRRHWPIKRIIQVIAESAIFLDLSESARKILGDDRVHTVIFGHTHASINIVSGSENKEYFNTGTWTEITSLDIVSLGKIHEVDLCAYRIP